MSGQGPAGPDQAFDRFERQSLGGNWTVYNGDVGIIHERDLGCLSKDAPMRGLGIVAWCGTEFAADQFSEAVISPEVDANAVLQVFVRRSTHDGRRYGFYWIPDGGGRWEIKRDGGTEAVVLAVAPSPSPAPGDTLRLEAAGDSIKGFHNGTEVVQAVDSALREPGQAGVVLNVARVERFEAPMASRWTGGSLPPRGGRSTGSRRPRPELAEGREGRAG